MDLIAVARRSNHFVDRETGVMQRVDAVNEAFVSLTVLTALQSAWSMPIADYDGGRFARRFVPVDMGSLKAPEKYRPPADMEAWAPEPTTDLDESRGETPEGVRIG